MATVGELLEAGTWLRTNQRHEITRTGHRQPIPPHVRAAVYLRDRGRCELCDWQRVDGPWHLDHIKPWSAGGADTTDNLRVLCERHNQQRSNHVDPLERVRRPATWWCVNCYDSGNVWRYHNGMPVCPIHVTYVPAKTPCTVVRGYRHHLEEHGELPDWHRRGPLEAGSIIAFCAHCRRPGVTDRTV